MRFPFYEYFSAKTYVFLTFKILQDIQFCSEKGIPDPFKRKKIQEIEVGIYDVAVKHFNLMVNNSR